MTAVESDISLGTRGRRTPTQDDFVPVAITPRYEAPPAGVDPDQSRGWIRRVAPIALAHKGMFSLAIGGVLFSLLLQVQIPNLIRRAIDESLIRKSTPLNHILTLMLIVGAARLIIGYISRYYLLKTAYRIEYDMRNIMYEHLGRLSFSFYDRVQSGQLISRANSDIRSVQMYLAFAPNIFAQCLVAVVAFIQMLTINVPLAFVTMSVMPFVVLVGVLMRRVMFPVSWIIQSRLAEVATVVDENINGVRVVKSFAAEEQQLRNLYSAARRQEWAVTTDARIRARWSPLIENLPRLGQALVLLYGGWLVIHGRTTVGTIVQFNALVLIMQPPFRLLGMIMMMGQRAKASAQRIYEILDEQPEIADRPGAYDLLECDGQVHFDNVTFAYANGTPVLDGFELTVAPGETVALVGRTGSGKSTVARLLARYYDVSGGAVRIDGDDIRDLTLVSLRHHIGMVIEEPFLFSVSIRDNIAYGRPSAPMSEVIAAAKAANAHEFIERLPAGYDTVVGERGYTLSGGQRQRISIARTLLVNPPILVLDDATSAIDVQIEQQIHDALTTLMQNRTTIIIGHRLSTISLADRIAVMEGGRVIASGTHDWLLDNEPRYSEILARVAEEEAEAEAAAAEAEADAVAHADAPNERGV